jgi:hypothetical protein
MQPPSTVALFTIVALGLTACEGRRIRQEYATLFDALPRRERGTPCANSVTERERDLIELISDASRARKKWDQPLPPDLADRLARADLTHATRDWICLMRDPARGQAAATGKGTLASLLFDRAERDMAVSADGAWRTISDALSLYEAFDPVVYIDDFQPAYFFARAERLLATHLPSTQLRVELSHHVSAATMTRTTLCAGLHEEYLSQGALSFAGYLAPLRAALINRWGAGLSAVFDDRDYMDNHRPSLEVWRALALHSIPSWFSVPRARRLNR